MLLLASLLNLECSFHWCGFSNNQIKRTWLRVLYWRDIESHCSWNRCCLSSGDLLSHVWNHFEDFSPKGSPWFVLQSILVLGFSLGSCWWLSSVYSSTWLWRHNCCFPSKSHCTWLHRGECQYQPHWYWRPLHSIPRPCLWFAWAD